MRMKKEEIITLIKKQTTYEREQLKECEEVLGRDDAATDRARAKWDEYYDMLEEVKRYAR